MASHNSYNYCLSECCTAQVAGYRMYLLYFFVLKEDTATGLEVGPMTRGFAVSQDVPQSHLLHGTSDLERCCIHCTFCIFLWWIYHSINPEARQHLTLELFVPVPRAVGGAEAGSALTQIAHGRIDAVAPFSTAGQGGDESSMRIPFPIKFYTRHVKQIPSRTAPGNAKYEMNKIWLLCFRKSLYICMGAL